MSESEKSIAAIIIVKTPQKVEEIKSKYCIVWDPSFGHKVDNLCVAINIMAEKGWRCVNITGKETSVYALMEKIT